MFHISFFLDQRKQRIQLINQLRLTMAMYPLMGKRLLKAAKMEYKAMNLSVKLFDQKRQPGTPEHWGISPAKWVWLKKIIILCVILH